MSLPLERPSQEDIDLARFQDNYTRIRFVEVYDICLNLVIINKNENNNRENQNKETYIIYGRNDLPPNSTVERIPWTIDRPIELKEHFDASGYQIWVDDQKQGPRINPVTRKFQQIYNEVPQYSVVLGDDLLSAYEEQSALLDPPRQTAPTQAPAVAPDGYTKYTKGFKTLYGGKYYPLNKQLHTAIVALNKSNFFKKQFISYVSRMVGSIPGQLVDTSSILNSSKSYRQYLVNALNTSATFNNNENRENGLFYLPPPYRNGTFVTYPHIWTNISENNEVIENDSSDYKCGRYLIDRPTPPPKGTHYEWNKENRLDKRIPFLSTPKVGIGRGRIPPGWGFGFNRKYMCYYYYNIGSPDPSTWNQPQLVYDQPIEAIEAIIQDNPRTEDVVVEAVVIPIPIESIDLHLPEVSPEIPVPVATPIGDPNGGKKSRRKNLIRKKSARKKSTRKKSARNKSTRKKNGSTRSKRRRM